MERRIGWVLEENRSERHCSTWNISGEGLGLVGRVQGKRQHWFGVFHVEHREAAPDVLLSRRWRRAGVA